MKTFKPEVIWAGETEWKPFSRWSYDDFQEVLESVEQSLENDRMYHGHIDKIRILDGTGKVVWPRSEANNH